MIKLTWFRRYRTAPARFRRIVQSCHLGNLRIPRSEVRRIVRGEKTS